MRSITSMLTSSFKTKAIVLVVLAILGGVLYYSQYYLDFTGGSSDKIYLSLVPNERNITTGIYTFDLESRKLSPALVDLEGPSQNFNGSFSQDGQMFAFISREYGDEYAQLNVMDRNMKNKRPITTSPYHKKDPRWSPDGNSIVFIVNSDGPESDNYIAVDTWEVYITDLEGNERFISKGANPIFSPDGSKLIILRSNGLHLVDIQTKSDQLVWNMVGGVAYLGMKLDISNNGSLLAWSVPDDGEILIIKINSWEPFSGFIKDRIQSSSFWPRFSPDDTYLVAQEVDWGDNDNQRLVIFDLNLKTKEVVFDLTDYVQTSMFIDDWN